MKDSEWKLGGIQPKAVLTRIGATSDVIGQFDWSFPAISFARNVTIALQYLVVLDLQTEVSLITLIQAVFFASLPLLHDRSDFVIGQ